MPSMDDLRQDARDEATQRLREANETDEQRATRLLDELLVQIERKRETASLALQNLDRLLAQLPSKVDAVMVDNENRNALDVYVRMTHKVLETNLASWREANGNLMAMIQRVRSET